MGFFKYRIIELYNGLGWKGPEGPPNPLPQAGLSPTSSANEKVRRDRCVLQLIVGIKLELLSECL